MEIHQRIEALEKQVKKINTLEVFMKRIIKVEERLGLLNLREKGQTKRNAINKTQSADRLNKGEFIKDIENLVLAKVKYMIQTEMEPVQNMFMELHNRISKLENQMTSLDKQATENIRAIQYLLQKKNQQEEVVKENPHEGQPIIFQEIHVDKLFMDKYEQTNNLGQLGIKELSGHLNIGATYDKGVIPNELVEEWKKEMDSLNQMKEDELQKETHDGNLNNEEELVMSKDVDLEDEEQ